VTAAIADDRRIGGNGIVLGLVQGQMRTCESQPLADIGLSHSSLASLIAPALEITVAHSGILPTRYDTRTGK
jgi:hypothetical protein